MNDRDENHFSDHGDADPEMERTKNVWLKSNSMLSIYSVRKDCIGLNEFRDARWVDQAW